MSHLLPGTPTSRQRGEHGRHARQAASAFLRATRLRAALPAGSYAYPCQRHSYVITVVTHASDSTCQLRQLPLPWDTSPMPHNSTNLDLALPAGTSRSVCPGLSTPLLTTQRSGSWPPLEKRPLAKQRGTHPQNILGSTLPAGAHPVGVPGPCLSPPSYLRGSALPALGPRSVCRCPVLDTRRGLMANACPQLLDLRLRKQIMRKHLLIHRSNREFAGLGVEF